MNSQNENRNLTTTDSTAPNTRFRIEKLEERIAPGACHLNPQGKEVGCSPNKDDDCRIGPRC
jgi:hypothetical protein